MSRHLTPIDDGALAAHEKACADKRRAFAMWASGVGVAAVGVVVTLTIFLAQYLIVGAITLELDRRFVPGRMVQRPTPASMLMSNAQAADMPAAVSK